MIADIIATVLLLGGLFFLLMAAIGVFRLGDPFLRLHASTKAGTLGAGLLVAGVAVAFPGNVTGTAIAIIVFLLATLPVAGHLLGRATYVSGADFHVDEDRDALKGVLPRASKSLELRLLGKGSQGQTVLDPLETHPAEKEKAPR
jgi:multicomponent Na+:H+ antiporter subunit G